MLTGLKAWAIVLSLCLVALAVGVEYFVFDPLLGRGWSALATAILLLAGVSGFSWEVWRLLEGVEARLRAAHADERAQRRQLEALGAASADLLTGIELDELAQKIVERSREVTGARYGALAIVAAPGASPGFYASGLDPAERARLGPPPMGHGLLALVLREGRPLRLDDLTAHPASAGFPAHHPRMRTLLAVPVRIRGAVVGSLYVCDREDGAPFSEADEQAMARFAVQAAVAMQNARLHERLAQLSVVAERERIAMDLHDGVIQSLFGVRLQLESALSAMPAEAEPHARIDAAVERLGAVMADIRHYIFDLRAQTAGDADLARLLGQLVASMREGPDFQPDLRVEGTARPVRRAVLWDLWHVARAVLTHAVRGPGGDRPVLTLRYGAQEVVLELQDQGLGWGTGPGGEAAPALEQAARRAEAHGGALTLEAATGGTRLRVAVPAAAAFAAPGELAEARLP